MAKTRIYLVEIWIVLPFYPGLLSLLFGLRAAHVKLWSSLLHDLGVPARGRGKREKPLLGSSGTSAIGSSPGVGQTCTHR